jgi:ABC-type phosphate transport system substrate-binding protein
MKIVIGLTLLAMMAFTSLGAASLGGLVSPSTLIIKGSSTVQPIAAEQKEAFPGYWKALVGANPTWGAHTIDTAIQLEGLGSGSAPTALVAGTADVGQMSRPLKTSEYSTLPTVQLWCVGMDSVAIVTSPDMTWFPAGLTTRQVADLFAKTPSTGTEYTTYGQFFTAQGIDTTGIPQAALDATIKRAVRDETSGTFDCFNIYFGTPNNINFAAAGRVNLAQNDLCQTNFNVYETVSAGNLAQNTEYVGFISSGYLETYTDMRAVNIAFNIAKLPSSVLAYNATQTPVWSEFVECNEPNVIYALSGIGSIWIGIEMIRQKQFQSESKTMAATR